MSLRDELIESFHRVLLEKEKQNGYFFFFLDINKNYKEIHEFLQDSFNWELTLRKLHLKRQLAIRNKKFLKDRYLSLFNALLVKFVICLYEKTFDIWDELEFSRGKYGKPFLVNRPYVFNLSDEDGIVSLAIDFSGKTKEIGVDLANPADIEAFGITDLKNFYKTEFKSIFTDNERVYLDQIFTNSITSREEQLNFLSHFWALKESYTKYLGVGLLRDLSNYEFLNISLPAYQEDYMNTTLSQTQDLVFFPKWNWVRQRKESCFNDNVSVTTCFLPGKKIICSIIASVNESEHTSQELSPLPASICPLLLLEILKQTPTN